MSGKFDRVIARLWESKEDRAIARAFVEQFAAAPGMDGRVEALLHEAAATADRVAAGELSMEAGRNYLASFASDGLGVAPHVMQDLGAWFDGAGAEIAAAAQPAAEPGSRRQNNRQRSPPSRPGAAAAGPSASHGACPTRGTVARSAAGRNRAMGDRDAFAGRERAMA
jgi:hypothetical protein